MISGLMIRTYLDRSEDALQVQNRPMRCSSRNDTLGFAERTRKNLLHIEAAFASGADVHVVTQLVTSLLGLVVFPWERGFQEHAKEAPLGDLIAKGWPRWKMKGVRCDTLGELIRVLRHSVAHGNIRFSSDSRRIEDISIEFENCPPNRPDLLWYGSISAVDLRTFCLEFVKLVDGIVG